MKPLENYIRSLRDIRASGAGTQETSYYPPLAALLDAVGRTLAPKVRCIMPLRNQGAGFPDGGFFTSEQFQKASAADPLPDQNPSRGVIEVKGTGEDAWETAASEQVLRYWERYRQVLVTNYRDFVLLGQGADGKPATLETYRLSESESGFWAAAAEPRKVSETHGQRFEGFLKRVMLHAAPLAKPEDVAWFLASYARDARARMDETDLPALSVIRAALENALGITFEAEKGEDFFRSTLVQTLFYGVFAAWVLWSKQPNAPRFDWRMAAWSLRVPMIKGLFEQIATPTKLGPLGLVEVLDWTGEMLNRVDRPAFFAEFEAEYAVQYFYEPFLQAFDPKLRKALGVWYTPPEIVRYMVARVDTVLREELDLPDGLADPRVHILDPCCGTGAYLVEVLKRIAETLRERGTDALSGDDVKRAAIERVFGFEIIPAPFVIAHLQLGLLLQNLGTPLSDDTERAGVYLTNALSGWDAPEKADEPGVQQLEFAFPELKQERDAANAVKRGGKILVVLGNPPYNAYAGVSPPEEQGLVEPYKAGLIDEWGIKKFNLDELYVRFFRLAERCIAELGEQRGVVCFISNHSWVSEPSFVVLRQHLLKSFDRFWIENMHGDRKISEYAPDGRTSETIFALRGFSPGIRQGVVTSLWVKSGKQTDKPQVLYNDNLDAAKAGERRAQLLATLHAENFDAQYTAAAPERWNRFAFRPLVVSADYLAWAKLVDLCGVPPYNGPIERRGNSLIVFGGDEAELERLAIYLNPEKSDAEVELVEPRFMKSSGEFKAKPTRNKLKGALRYDPTKISRYPFKPFDVRQAYLSADLQPLFSRPSPNLLELRAIDQNAFFITRDTADKFPEGPPFYFSRLVCDYDSISGHARHFPIYLHRNKSNQKDTPQPTLFNESTDTPIANLSRAARAYLATLGITDPDADTETAGLIWMHALAIGYSPAYLSENADGIRQDWPRIPLPDNRDALLASAELGAQVAALLDTETDVQGVTSGAIRPELRSIGVISRVGGGSLDPNAGDLALTVGWGHGGGGKPTMPGKGKRLERDFAADETALPEFGEQTSDLYLNGVAYWRDVPQRVWDYTIGGYQVIKKWLSYREEKVLGRPLTVAEAREVTNMARRIAAILRLEPELDANYEGVKRASFKFNPSGVVS